MLDLVKVGQQRTKRKEWTDDQFLSLSDYILAAKKAIKYFGPRLRPGLDREMLNSEDSISSVANAMMQADWQYDPTRGMTKYNLRNNYALYAMRSYMSRMNRKSKKPHNKKISLNRTLDAGQMGGRGMQLYSTIVDMKSINPSKVLTDKEQTNYIQNCINKSGLTVKQQYCINEYYSTNKTYDEIGKELDITKERVRQHINNALIKIRKNVNV